MPMFDDEEALLAAALARIGLDWRNVFATWPNVRLLALDAAANLSADRTDYYLLEAAKAFENAGLAGGSAAGVMAAEIVLTLAWEESMAPIVLRMGRR